MFTKGFNYGKTIYTLAVRTNDGIVLETKPLKNGGKRSSVEIVVEDFNFVGGGSGKDGGSSYSSSAAQAPSTDTSEDIPTDIPEGEMDLSEIPL